MHAASATGQTVFVEPLETIELNNRLVQLGEDEAAEIARILRGVDRRASRPNADRSRTPPTTIAEIRFAVCAGPICARVRRLHAGLHRQPCPSRSMRARHPVLESTLRPQGRAVVPLTLALGGGETVLVISGPNTGGKTVALKTVGLAVLAAQSGIPVAAQSARLRTLRSRAGGYRR